MRDFFQNRNARDCHRARRNMRNIILMLALLILPYVGLALLSGLMKFP
jgi:hypothetical protein